MGYASLTDFRHVFDCPEFDAIAPSVGRDPVRDVALVFSSLRAGSHNEESRSSSRSLLESFRSNLLAFIEREGLQSVPEALTGFRLVDESIRGGLVLLDLPDVDRANTGRRSSSLEKDFLRGVALVSGVVSLVFDPSFNTSSVKVSSKQLREFILDETIGLGKKYAFNTVGKDAFLTRLRDMSVEELLVIKKLLENRKQARTVNGWLDFGSHRDAVRILGERSLFGKTKLYYLFKVTEHARYEDKLNEKRSKRAFAA